jgi:hypothetical protein
MRHAAGRGTRISNESPVNVSLSDILQMEASARLRLARLMAGDQAEIGAHISGSANAGGSSIAATKASAVSWLTPWMVINRRIREKGDASPYCLETPGASSSASFRAR